MTEKINLKEFTGEDDVHILSGRDLGQKARQRFKLDSIDQNKGVVEVIFPAYVYSVTPSFFEGLLGESVRAHGGNLEQFRDHFHIVAQPMVLDQLERGLAEMAASDGLGGKL